VRSFFVWYPALVVTTHEHSSMFQTNCNFELRVAQCHIFSIKPRD